MTASPGDPALGGPAAADPAGDVDADVRTGWSRVTRLFGGEVVATDHAVVCLTGAPVAWFNPWFPTGTDLPATALDEVLAVYRDSGLAGCGWLRVGTNHAVREDVRRRGLPVEAGPPAMRLGPISASPPPRRADLEVVQVSDLATLRETRGLLQDVFEIGDDLAGLLVADTWLDQDDLVVLLARRDGRPVCSATAHVHDGVVGVYSVATPADERGQGLGTALTWEAIRAGAERGCDVAVLQSSEIGYGVYERMGFQRVGSYDMVTV